MFADFFRALAELFTVRRSRLEISGLLLTMALLPVSELVVTRMFSHLILNGPERYDADPQGVVVDASVFFLAFALSRAIHHVVRLNRVRIFRRGFDSAGEVRPRHQEAWSWAAAFELSTAMVALIQIAAFCLLFLWFDLGVGLANLVIGAGVLWLIALIYRRQLRHQLAYLVEGNRPGTTAVGERVGKRVRDAELGAVVASLAMAFSLGVVLIAAVRGSVGGADAIVLFIGLRMMYSQVGNLSASAMRFARVKARLEAGRTATDVVDPDDEFADPDLEVTDEQDLEPATPTAHRTQLVSQMVLAGQRGELDRVHTFGARLRATKAPMKSELRAQEAAEAFALLAESDDDRQPLPLLWWPRPFPGTVGNWVSPLLLRRLTDRPVLFQAPAAAALDPHLVLVGSVAGSVHEHAVVVGTGARSAEVEPDPRATYVSVRGPLTAEAVRRAGGTVEHVGDPTLLASRVLPVERTGGNGRLAFVRHVSHETVRVGMPGTMDEVSLLASRPDDIERFVRSLAGYDGVVTSDVGTLALCHSYGLPAVPVTFAGHDDLRFVLSDYGRGAGFDDELVPLVVEPDLARVTWADVLDTRTPGSDVLDSVQAAVEQGVTTYLERVQV